MQLLEHNRPLVNKPSLKLSPRPAPQPTRATRPLQYRHLQYGWISPLSSAILLSPESTSKDPSSPSAESPVEEHSPLSLTKPAYLVATHPVRAPSAVSLGLPHSRALASGLQSSCWGYFQGSFRGHLGRHILVCVSVPACNAVDADSGPALQRP